METASTPAVLLLDLPPSALAGIDLLSFTTTARFRGVKNLPAGFHFAFVGSNAALSERHGVWFDVQEASAGRPATLVVAKWNAASETLATETDETALLQWRARLGGIWREGLTPYRQFSPTSSTGALAEAPGGDWPLLTSQITRSLLSRITGGGGGGGGGGDNDDGANDTWHLGSASSSQRDVEHIPGLEPADSRLLLRADGELDFLPVDLQQTWRAGATGRERTDAARDRSWALSDVTAKVGGGATAILGELQFCFLAVLTVNNFSALEQWKRLLTLVLTCRRAVARRPAFFVGVLAALRLQLQHCRVAEGGGLIDLADEAGSLLRRLLERFRAGLKELSSAGGDDDYDDVDVRAVADELDDLEDFLRAEHGWQFGGTFAKSGVLELEDGEQVRMDTTAFDEEDETGEFAPQVVDLTPEQARLLGVDVDAPKAHAGLARTPQHQLQEVVQSEDETDSDDDEEPVHAEESEGSEAGDLDEMDARY